MTLLQRVRRHGWWIAFVLLLGTSLVVATLTGQYLASLSRPTELGRSAVGEWVDLTDVGFRARIDDVTIATHFPEGQDPSTDRSAPEGAAYLRVRMTVMPLLGPEEPLNCRLELHNAGGEQLTLVEYGLEGPADSDCVFSTDDGPRVTGEPYETQVVFVVVPEATQAYTLQLHTTDGDRKFYQSITV